MNKRRGEESIKTKTKSIVPILQSDEYARKPQPFMRENNKLISKAYIMGRHGMLQCAANFSAGYAGKNCRSCGVLDDEDHRINNCTTWQRINLSSSSEKINYEDIYPTDRDKSLKIVEKILTMWDLGNGKNTMKVCPMN